MRYPRLSPVAILAVLALVLGSAALIVALRPPHHMHQPPRTHNELCSLLGSLIGNADHALSASAAHLYGAERC